MGSEGVTFTDYRPAKLPYGKPHPDPVVETASLGAVEPPDVTYELQIQVSLAVQQPPVCLHLSVCSIAPFSSGHVAEI